MATGDWDIIKAQFVTSAVRAGQYPVSDLTEIAFIGRSNVGKSSLINSLCRQKSLARVSQTPGKTQTINFYDLKAKRMDEGIEERSGFFLVDLPGYGFAKTNKNNREVWSGFISQYLSEHDNVAMVCQLIDIRHAPMESDMECFRWLQECGHNVQVVLTKADKLSKNAAMSQKALYRKTMGLFEDQIIVYSSTTHTQRTELIGRIMSSIEKFNQTFPGK